MGISNLWLSEHNIDFVVIFAAIFFIFGVVNALKDALITYRWRKLSNLWRKLTKKD